MESKTVHMDVRQQVDTPCSGPHSAPPGLTPDAYTDADINTLLGDLNTHVHRSQQLGLWLERTGLQTSRVVDTPSLTYLRLSRSDEHHGAIVLMLLDGVWERTL